MGPLCQDHTPKPQTISSVRQPAYRRLHAYWATSISNLRPHDGILLCFGLEGFLALRRTGAHSGGDSGGVNFLDLGFTYD